MLGKNNTKPFESHSEKCDSKTSIDKVEETIFLWNQYQPEKLNMHIGIKSRKLIQIFEASGYI